jgi:hypothetical protein
MKGGMQKMGQLADGQRTTPALVGIPLLQLFNATGVAN